MSTDERRTRLILVRHGETVWHADNRYAGASSDIDLTERGREQARALARWCHGHELDAVVASPVRRALETARPAARALGVAVDVVDDLREADFGMAEGRTLDELSHVAPDMVARFRADPVAHPFPGADSPDEVAERVSGALRAIAAAHAGRAVLVVAHNTSLRLALCALLGLPVSRYRQLFPRLRNGALTEITVPAGPRDPAGVALLSLNVPPALDPNPTGLHAGHVHDRSTTRPTEESR